MPKIEADKAPECQCNRCDCSDLAEITLGKNPLCGCCAADCPDVHGEAAWERREQFWTQQAQSLSTNIQTFKPDDLDLSDEELKTIENNQDRRRRRK